MVQVERNIGRSFHVIGWDRRGDWGGTLVCVSVCEGWGPGSPRTTPSGVTWFPLSFVNTINDLQPRIVLGFAWNPYRGNDVCWRRLFYVSATESDISARMSSFIWIFIVRSFEYLILVVRYEQRRCVESCNGLLRLLPNICNWQSICPLLSVSLQEHLRNRGVWRSRALEVWGYRGHARWKYGVVNMEIKLSSPFH